MSERLLVIEDDRQIAAILRDGLRHHGYSVEVETDGRAGLAAVRDRAPDLVVLDLMLPEVDGLTVCRHDRYVGYLSQKSCVGYSAHVSLPSAVGVDGRLFITGGSDC